MKKLIVLLALLAIGTAAYPYDFSTEAAKTGITGEYDLAKMPPGYILLQNQVTGEYSWSAYETPPQFYFSDKALTIKKAWWFYTYDQGVLSQKAKEDARKDRKNWKEVSP